MNKSRGDLMNTYTIPIMWSIIIFPFIAGLFTIPYVLNQYHKYGSIPMLRVGIVYSFILYLIAAYFLVILPLPSIEEVQQITGPSTQLVPFQFITDFIQHTSLIITDPSTYLKAIKEPYFYQVIYNILLFVPLGIYLRYYFKCSFKKVFLWSFFLSLFFEITQLTGLYGIYPRSYRLFDVDDLMINTLGGIVGFFLAGIILKILPSRDKIDFYAYELGKEITVWKRMVSFLLDWFLLGIVEIILGFILNLLNWNDIKITTTILILIYFVIIPCFTKGKTLGKKFLNLKLVTLDNKETKFYHYLIRYFLLYLVALPLPIYGLYLIIFLNNYMLKNNHFFLTLIALGMLGIISLFYYSFQFILMAKKEILWYEKLSKTKNISTIVSPQIKKGTTDSITESISEN